MRKRDYFMLLIFAAIMLTLPIWGPAIDAGYPDIMQRFAVFGLIAVGFNLLFGLTGYLSFGHAAFLGVGSYTAVWCFKLFTMDVIPAIILSTIMGGLVALILGFVALRRSGIYFSILTLAFAQMMYSLAYSVLTPLTNGETGLQLALGDARILDRALGTNPESGLPSTSILGFGVSNQGMTGYWICAIIAIIGFYIALRITRSSFGIMLRGIKSNQTRMSYTGLSARPYLITVFVISGMYAGLAGGLLASVDPLAGAERMYWTASGEIVLMTILGGVGTLFGPILGAGIIKWLEAKLSTFNESVVEQALAFLPDSIEHGAAVVVSKFVGEGWHLSLGIIFMLIVIFLPGGVMEGLQRLAGLFGFGKNKSEGADSTPAE
jgi:ABC-type branched-subunit amino acid transport system permease subunit